MPVYELVFETGAHSLATYADDAEATEALQAHQERAKTGVSGTPKSTPRSDLGANEVPGATSWPAERISKVYKFDFHPADYRANDEVPADEITTVLQAIAQQSETGQVNVQVAAAAIRETSSPFSASSDEPFGSMYAMDHTELTDWSNV